MSSISDIRARVAATVADPADWDARARIDESCVADLQFLLDLIGEFATCSNCAGSDVDKGEFEGCCLCIGENDNWLSDGLPGWEPDATLSGSMKSKS